MATILPATENPFQPEIDTLHAGKVFVLTPGTLRRYGAVGHDGSDPTELVNRFMLCLWDLDDDRSLWITLQSIGDFEVPYASKRLYAGVDPNWMDQTKVTRHRNGTLWCLGAPGVPFRFVQTQKRAVALAELESIRARISHQSFVHFAGT